MKARKDRYAVSISVQQYEQMHREAAQDALRDGARQGIAVCMMALEMAYGWRGKRLRAFCDEVDAVLHMPCIMGKDPTAAGAIDRIRDLYQIDLDKLEITVDLEA